jgi:hypothetical protein
MKNIAPKFVVGAALAVRFFAACALAVPMLSPTAALASQASQVVPGPPEPMTKLAADITAALQAIATCNSGPSAPTVGPANAPIAFMCWWNTVTTPAVLNYWDGTQWVNTGLTLNQTSHAFGVSTSALPSLQPGQVLGNSGTSSAAPAAVSLFGAVAPVGGLALYASPSATGSGNCLSSGNACSLPTACAFVHQIATFLGPGGPVNLANGTYNTIDPGTLSLCPIVGDGGGNNQLVSIIGNNVSPSSVIWAVPNGDLGLYVKDGGEASISGIECAPGTNATCFQNAGQQGVLDYGNVIWGTSGSGSTHVSGSPGSYTNLVSGGESISANFSYHWIFAGNAQFNAGGATTISNSTTFTEFLIATGSGYYLNLSGWSFTGSSLTGIRATLTGPGYMVTAGAGSCASILPGTNSGGCSFNAGAQDNAGDGMTGSGLLVGQQAPTINNPILTAHSYAGLPSSPTAGQAAYIVDGLAANCGDSSCTTWGTNVTGGGGALNLRIWWNGTHWTLTGK